VSPWLTHLPILPVAVPLVTGAALLLTRDGQRPLRLALTLASLLAQLWVAVLLLGQVTGHGAGEWSDGIGVYLLGGWPAPFGIVAVVDRLSVLMVLLTAVLGAACWLYATARWDRAGVHFHALYQFLLMGLNGAFLTGDLFNLFVFFEVLLVASYGLMLHGSGRERVSAGMHYIAINLVASFLLLLGLAIIYGLSGTLNMADLAVRAGALSGSERELLEAGIAMLGIAFLIKAAAWPLNFWLPAAYANACPPVAGVFAIMTKVGIYALLRISTLLVPSGAPAAFGTDWMFLTGIATLAFASIGILAATQVERQAGYAIIMSSGILLAALGMPGMTLAGPALYYLINSVLALGALFMLLEMIQRTQPFGADVLAASQELFDLDDPEPHHEPDEVVGIAIPAAMAFLGLSFFACALLIVGLPPLSGFVAKFSLLATALQTAGPGHTPNDAWVLMAAILLSGLAALIALCRTGIRLFWSAEDLKVPRLRIIEAGPVAVLLGACALLTVQAGPFMDYMDETAHLLEHPVHYVNAVITGEAP